MQIFTLCPKNAEFFSFIPLRDGTKIDKDNMEIQEHVRRKKTRKRSGKVRKFKRSFGQSQTMFKCLSSDGKKT